MDRSSLYNVIHLSLSFILIFMSYIVAQTFQTSSDYARHGAFAVGIIYSVFCLGNLALSSHLTNVLGVRMTLILSSLTYVFFIAANIQYHTWLLYTSAFLMGLGAALLWTAQSVYVAVSISKYERVNNLVPTSAQGFINGTFFGVYQFYLIIGNLLASLLFRLNYSQWIIFTIMTAIAAVGVFTLIFLRPVKIPNEKKQRSIYASLSMLLEIPFVLLIPTLCYSGLLQGFAFGTAPTLIIEKSRKFLMFALYGVVGVCSSIIFGKLSDYFGRRLLIFAVGGLANIIIFGLFLTVWIPPFDPDRLEVFIVMVICLSIGDTIFMAQSFSVIAILYGETRPAEAFACMKIFQTGFIALAFVEQVYLSFSVQILCLILLLSFSLITLIYENYCIVSLDTGKPIMSRQEEATNRLETENEVEIPLTTLSNTI